jgi:hypothetical protein
MPTLRIPPDLDLHYVVDDYTDPWTKPETILLLHGNAESGAAWYGWVPSLARRYRVVRPDMRGYGASTPMPRNYPWSLDAIIGDYLKLMDTLGIDRFHLAGAKIRAPSPEHSQHLNGCRRSRSSAPAPYRAEEPGTRKALVEEFEKHGVEHWARRTMVRGSAANFRRKASNCGSSSWGALRCRARPGSCRQSRAPTYAPILPGSRVRRSC